MWLPIWFVVSLLVVDSLGNEWSTVTYNRSTTTRGPAPDDQDGWRTVSHNGGGTNSEVPMRGRSVNRRPSDEPRPVGVVRSQSAPNLRQISDLKLQELSEELLARDVNNAAANITFKRWAHGFIKIEVADENRLRNRTTYKALENLIRFYNRDLSVAESKLAEKKAAEDTFLEAVMNTEVMKHLMKYLATQGFLTVNEQGQLSWMRTIWFTPYHRGKEPGGPNSSGFEHIFLGETDSRLQKVDGMHDWFVLYLEQNRSQVILKEKDSIEYKDALNTQVKGILKKVSLTYNGFYKPSLTIAVGFSPELQMAYDTLCFFFRMDEKCALKVGNKYFLIQSFSWYLRPLDRRVIASAFPEIDRQYDGKPVEKTAQYNRNGGAYRSASARRG